MRNKKLITLLVCLAMSVASVGVMSSCGDKLDEQSSSAESMNEESSVGGTEESSMDSSEESSVDSSEESSMDSSEEDSSTSDAEKETYTVSFDGANGSEVTTQTVEEGEILEEPTDPTKDYYTFDGWYNGETKWNFAEDTVSGEITLTAKWTAKVYTVKFVGVDGTTVVEEKTYTCENVDSFVAPAVPNAPEHFTDGHWDKAPEEYLIYSEEPIVVTAVYVRPEYTVKFVNGETEVSSGKVGEGLLLEEPTAPTKDYYTFDGWYNGETKWNFAEDTVLGEMTLTAKFNAIEYKVQFVDFDGNTTELTYTAENVDDFALPAVPAAPEHYENARWNKTEEAAAAARVCHEAESLPGR